MLVLFVVAHIFSGVDGHDRMPTSDVLFVNDDDGGGGDDDDDDDDDNIKINNSNDDDDKRIFYMINPSVLESFYHRCPVRF